MERISIPITLEVQKSQEDLGYVVVSTTSLLAFDPIKSWKVSCVIGGVQTNLMEEHPYTDCATQIDEMANYSYVDEIFSNVQGCPPFLSPIFDPTKQNYEPLSTRILPRNQKLGTYAFTLLQK